MDVKTQKKLDHLEETKHLIREAIEEKGQTVTDSDSFRSYADKIANIETGADVSGVTATAADVRQGKIIVDAQGNPVVGTLVVEQKAPDVIWVGKDSVSNALVGTGVIRYVTFCNHDGTETYGQKSVIAGENCVDPVTAGHMDAPTRESTAQYNYTFSGGWATEPDGGINADALKNVTEDRTVYANFIAAVRYYTITYLDSDGTTVLKTESLAYGATPSYKPTSADHTFVGWVPEAATVTGDASYTATWKAKPAFATASWADIKATADAGEASTAFNLGDTKIVTLTYADGTTEDVPFEIVDFLTSSTKLIHPDVTAHMAIMATRAIGDKVQYPYNNASYSSSTPSYRGGKLDKYVQTLLTYFPADLQAVMVDARNPNDFSYMSWKLLTPMAENFFGYGLQDSTTTVDKTEQFDLCANGSRNVTRDKDGNAVAIWTKEPAYTNGKTYPQYIDASGKLRYTTSQYDMFYARPVFYI